MEGCATVSLSVIARLASRPSFWKFDDFLNLLFVHKSGFAEAKVLVYRPFYMFWRRHSSHPIAYSTHLSSLAFAAASKLDLIHDNRIADLPSCLDYKIYMKRRKELTQDSFVRGYLCFRHHADICANLGDKDEFDGRMSVDYINDFE